MARTLAGELGRSGVRVNSVVPGHIWGPPLEEFLAERAERLGTTPQAAYEEIAAQSALRRIATAEEVADAAVFLASPLARAITGQSLDVNGPDRWPVHHPTPTRRRHLADPLPAPPNDLAAARSVGRTVDLGRPDMLNDPLG